MENTKIEWADHTANFWSGCTKVSPGCANCYAETLSTRFPTFGKWGKGATRKRHTSADKLVRKLERMESEPLSTLIGDKDWVATGYLQVWDKEKRQYVLVRRRPRVFVNSLADWLDPEVPVEWLAELLEAIRLAPHLDFLLLTKRPELWRDRIVEAQNTLPDDGQKGRHRWFENWLNVYAPCAPSNVWIGASVEDQIRADERIPALLKIPARVRFLSCEPLLGPVDLNRNLGGTRWIGGQRGCCGTHSHSVRAGEVIHGVLHETDPRTPHHHHDDRCARGIDWVIVGGESGHGARPMQLGWAGSLVRQCKAAGVAVFVKQLGAHPLGQAEDGSLEPWPISDKKGGNIEEFPAPLKIRQFPEVAP
jgi:protein gp37